jgi:hypothetical protein
VIKDFCEDNLPKTTYKTINIVRRDEGDTPPRQVRGAAVKRAMTTTSTLRGPSSHKETYSVLDSGADVNVISPGLARELCLRRVEIPVPRMRWGGGGLAPCTGAYTAVWEGTDSTGRHRESEIVLYALERPGVPCILGMPGMSDLRIEVFPSTSRWRFAEEELSIRLVTTEELQQEDLANIYELRSEDIAPILHIDEFDGPKENVALPDEYQDFSSLFNDELAATTPCADSATHAIETTKDPPFGPIYNLSVRELEILRKYIDEAMQNGWIRPSTSPAGAPILFVPKKGGELRLCVDYRGLNKVTIKNRYPLPLISEMLDRLQGAGWYTKLDMKNAYHRIKIQPGDEWKTAFRTRYGHFEYLVMPFGLANAPATFQAYINKALSGLVDTICIVYLDDVLIYSGDREEHVRCVRAVLARLRQFGLFVNLRKCKFFTQEVEFLGFVVGTRGVRMDPERIETITNWPTPQSYAEIQTFLGFSNFYRRFIARYSKITAPLTHLFKGSKNGRQGAPFQWPSDADNAFRQLRAAFSTAPILVHFDPKLRIRVETDASAVAVAAILSQLQGDGKWHPVAYWSRKLKDAEINYHTYEQELLAIVAAFAHWRHYLDGSYHPIEVLTDHNNLVGFANVKQLNGRQARWTMLLSAYDFIITHRAGKLNPADAPSRRPDYAGESPGSNGLLPTLQTKLNVLARDNKIQALSIWQEKGISVGDAPYTLVPTEEVVQGTPDCEFLSSQAKRCYRVARGKKYRMDNPSVPRVLAITALEKEGPYGDVDSIPSIIKQLQECDPHAREVRGALGKDKNSQPGWSISTTNVLKRDGATYVPQDYAVKHELLKRYHDDPYAGHFGVARTLDLLKRKYFWEHMHQDVKDYVQSCDICQKTKVKRHAPYGQLQSLPRPQGPWQELTLDFMSGVPSSRRNGREYDALLVITDRYTKMALYIPVTKTLTAADLADILVDKVFSRFGVPKGIISDRDPRFTGTFWSELCYHARIKRRLSTAFHPQTDGQTERQNQTIQEYLRAFCSENQTQWAGLLPLAEFAYNNSKHSSIGISPFMAMYGYHPEIYFDSENTEQAGEVPAAGDRIRQLQDIRESLTKRWEKAVASQAKFYNKRHIPMIFNKDDLVLISTRNLKLTTESRKLNQRMMGPFRVLEPVGSLAYRVELPPNCKIHPVFSVSLLEKYHRRADDGEAIEVLPPPEIIDGQEEWEVEEILDTRRKGKAKQYLVKWTGYSKEFNQWVPVRDLGNAAQLRSEFESRRKQEEKGSETTGSRTGRAWKDTAASNRATRHGRPKK